MNSNCHCIKVRSHALLYQRFLSTHRMKLRRVDINEVNGLIQKHSKILPDFVSVDQSSPKSFKITVKVMMQTSSIELELKESKCETTNESIIDVYETKREIAMLHKSQMSIFEGKLKEIEQKIQKDIDSK